jgi:hypothetical protein
VMLFAATIVATIVAGADALRRDKW